MTIITNWKFWISAYENLLKIEDYFDVQAQAHVAFWYINGSMKGNKWKISSHYETMPNQIYRKFHLQKLKIFR